MNLWTIEIEQESDGRWIAEVLDVPGAMAYGSSRSEAATKVIAIAEEDASEVREL